MSKLSKADRDVVALTVLALLMTGPRHTYEMHRLMIDTHKDFVTGLPRSMYHAVEKLHRDGLIDAVETRKDGPRPERTVYALTPAGSEEVRRRVRSLLCTPDPDSTLFVAALSFLACLPVPAAVESLTERRDELDRRIASMSAALDELGKRLNRLLLIELEFERARHVAERDWVASLVADLDSGALRWPDDPRELIAEVPLP